MNLNSLGINLSAYQELPKDTGFSGDVQSSPEAMQDLAKALQAGSITGQSTLNLSNASGAPLKIESLDNTLKMITYKESEIVLWRRVPKSPAYNTVEEYNQLTSYGEDRGGFISEGELPQEEDSTYIRRAQHVKFIGVTKSVTHVMTVVKSVLGNAVATEAKNGVMWVLRKLNRAVHSANTEVIPSEFNGVYAQHAKHDGTTYLEGSLDAYLDSPSVVDLRGSYLKEEHVEDSQEAIIENHGIGTEIFGHPKIFSDFVKEFYGQKRFIAGSDAIANGISGQSISAHETEFGRVKFTKDIFMGLAPVKRTTTTSTHSKAPGAIVPDGGTPIAAVGSDTSAKWVTADAGDYLYMVTAINQYGESAPTLLDASAVSIAAGGAVDLKFTKATTGELANGFVVYRGVKDSIVAANTKFYKCFEIPAAGITAGYDGGAAGILRDRNRFLPNTFQAFIIENDPEIWTFRQLLPIFKMDLAITSPAYRFMILNYGTLILAAPRKMTRVINIGKRSN